MFGVGGTRGSFYESGGGGWCHQTRPGTAAQLKAAASRLPFDVTHHTIWCNTSHIGEKGHFGTHITHVSIVKALIKLSRNLEINRKKINSFSMKLDLDRWSNIMQSTNRFD